MRKVHLPDSKAAELCREGAVEENHLLKEFMSAKALIDHANKVAHLIDNSKMFVKRITEDNGRQSNCLIM